MFPAWIVEDWRRRIAHLRTLRADPSSPDSWLAPLRLRVLLFLLRRYGSSDGPAAPASPPLDQPPHAAAPKPEFCAVTEVVLTPPKSRDAIRAILEHIHRINRRPPRRPWLWWPI